MSKNIQFLQQTSESSVSLKLCPVYEVDETEDLR